MVNLNSEKEKKIWRHKALPAQLRTGRGDMVLHQQQKETQQKRWWGDTNITRWRLFTQGSIWVKSSMRRHMPIAKMNGYRRYWAMASTLISNRFIQGEA